MKNNKKGFTLVELLAVIVILGVLLLIAVPAVSNIIDSSKKKSFESAAKLMIENVETVALMEKTTGTTLTACKIKIADIDIERGSKGTSPSGYISVDTSGKGTIKYTDGTFTTEGTLSALSTTKSGTAIADPAAAELCTWWD